jgi:hypothetical protein
MMQGLLLFLNIAPAASWLILLILRHCVASFHLFIEGLKCFEFS